MQEKTKKQGKNGVLGLQKDGVRAQGMASMVLGSSRDVHTMRRDVHRA
jgi:hypothetical protein